MKRFGPNDWHYEQSSPMAFINRFPSSHFSEEEKRTLARALIHGGGKALGLLLCKKLAQTNSKLRVPAWTWLRPTERLQKDSILQLNHELGLSSTDDVILRSSDLMEDWMSAESGEYSTQQTMLSAVPHCLAKLTHRSMPYVVQASNLGWELL